MGGVNPAPEDRVPADMLSVPEIDPKLLSVASDATEAGLAAHNLEMPESKFSAELDNAVRTFEGLIRDSLGPICQRLGTQDWLKAIVDLRIRTGLFEAVTLLIHEKFSASIRKSCAENNHLLNLDRYLIADLCHGVMEPLESNVVGEFMALCPAVDWDAVDKTLFLRARTFYLEPRKKIRLPYLISDLERQVENMARALRNDFSVHEQMDPRALEEILNTWVVRTPQEAVTTYTPTANILSEVAAQVVDFAFGIRVETYKICVSKGARSLQDLLKNSPELKVILSADAFLRAALPNIGEERRELKYRINSCLHGVKVIWNLAQLAGCVDVTTVPDDCLLIISREARDFTPEFVHALIDDVFWVRIHNLRSAVAELN